VKSLGQRVRFEGMVANDAITALYAHAGLFVFPSIWQEPFGLPLIEAMAAGLPVIATVSGAFPEIVQHGVTGLLVERGNPETLAKAIDRLLVDPSLRLRMGTAGRARIAELFTWDRSVARLVELYERCLGG
jgi:glycosyltransferase involved in cell wall biosynthesis